MVTGLMIGVSVLTFGLTAPITIGMFTGALWGGVSAHLAGGDIGRGMLFGAGVGGVTGALAGGFAAGATAEGSFFAQGGFSFLDRAIITGTEFAIAGAGIGAVQGYGGGVGSGRDVFRGAALGFAYGFASGAVIGAIGSPWLHGANFAEPATSNAAVPYIFTTAQGIAAVTPTPIDDIVVIALTVAVSIYAASQARRGPASEPYPGYNKGKRVGGLVKSQAKAAPPGHNPAPNPIPPDNWWKRFLDKLAQLLGP